MATKDKTQIKVGFFVVLGLLLGMYVIFMLGGEKQLFQTRYGLVSYFEDISGLRAGAPIQLAGLKVGYVDEIKFPKDISEKEIEVELRINKKFQERIREDSVATVETQGLLGDKYIYVTIGSIDQPVLKDGSTIKSQESASLLTIAQKSGEILSDLKQAANSASKLFSDMHSSKEDIRASIHSVKNILNQIEKGGGLAHALLYDPKGKEAVADISDSLKSLKDILSSADSDDKKDSQVSGIIQNLRSASLDIKDIAGKVNRGEGTIGGLLTDPSIYNDLRGLMGRANRNKLLKAVIRSTLAENDKIEN